LLFNSVILPPPPPPIFVIFKNSLVNLLNWFTRGKPPFPDYLNLNNYSAKRRFFDRLKTKVAVFWFVQINSKLDSLFSSNHCSWIILWWSQRDNKWLKFLKQKDNMTLVCLDNKVERINNRILLFYFSVLI